MQTVTENPGWVDTCPRLIVLLVGYPDHHIMLKRDVKWRSEEKGCSDSMSRVSIPNPNRYVEELVTLLNPRVYWRIHSRTA